jgi:hypothetical protein
MSYKLADGSKSTDYKIGDEFRLYTNPIRVFVFTEDDDTAHPWFKEGADCARPCAWLDMSPVKAKKKNASLIRQLRSTIRYLERTIAELES